MLQIASGKLFQREAEHENRLRGVIYTNLKIQQEREIHTDAGKILPTSNLGHSLALVYEFTELIEAQESGPGVLISHGVDPYISDFSTILSFGLDCIATPDYELTDRLLSARRGPSTRDSPNNMIQQVFDNRVICNRENENHFVGFVNHLIGLKRRTFLPVLRAIKTYVTGIHRIPDDIELAYTLLVASIESLAQDFDEHKPTWADLDQSKRQKIDYALSSADEEVAENVRSAILEIEHTALARRFRDFVLNTVRPSFFREEAKGILNPITRYDFPGSLNKAYRARSKYIHNLRELPRSLSIESSFSETIRIDRGTWLTVQGLSRVARHVIFEFIKNQPTVSNEVYDYSLERAGVIQAHLAPQYWVGNVNGMDKNTGPKKLEGFLSQLGSHLLKEPNSSITDLTPVLENAENLIPKINKTERRPYIVLYFLFNAFIPEENRMPGMAFLEKEYGNEIAEPAPETSFMALFLNISSQWNLDEHEKAVRDYFRIRDHKFGFRAPRVLEAGIILMLAERYRLNGDMKKAKSLIAQAVENYPDHEGLKYFEEKLSEDDSPIYWESILLPSSPTEG